MPEELFSVVATASVTQTLKRVVTRRDDGGVVVSQTPTRDDASGGTPITERTSFIEFSAAEWAQITQYAFTPPPMRAISLAAFLDRVIANELKAIKNLVAIDPTTALFWERLQARQTSGVNLDSQKLIAALTYVKNKSLDPGTPTNARVWPDAETADTRIAALRA